MAESNAKKQIDWEQELNITRDEAIKGLQQASQSLGRMIDISLLQQRTENVWELTDKLPLDAVKYDRAQIQVHRIIDSLKDWEAGVSNNLPTQSRGINF